MSQDPEQLEAMLADYVEGNLDEAGVRAVESHLAANPSGRALIDAMRGDRETLSKLPRLTVPGDLSEDLRGQLERELLLNDKPIGTIGTGRFSPSVAAIAAMLMVGLGLGGVAYVLLANRPTPYGDVAIQETTAKPPTASATTRTRMQLSVPDRADETTDAVQPAKSEGNSNVAELQPEATPADSFRREIYPARGAPVAPPAASVTPEGSLAAVSDGTEDKAASVGGAVGGAASAETSVADRANADLPPQATLESTPAATPAETRATVSAVTPALPAAPKLPELDIASAAPPPQILAALADQALDNARRSVVIAVEQRDALDAFAAVSRVARVNRAPFEVTDRAAEIALPGSSNAMQQNAVQQKIVRQRDVDPDAEVAVIARGLTTAAAAGLQSDLKKLEPAIDGIAYDVPVEFADKAVVVAGPTTTAAVADADEAKNTTTRPADTRVTTGASTRPSVIMIGERLRVTLVDPDAFDLRTQHEVVVDAQGAIALPSLEHVHAAGESIEALRVAIAEAYQQAKLMRRPVVKVEAIESGVASERVTDNVAAQAKLVDVYLVVRKPGTLSTPATTMPTEQEAAATQPTSTPTSQPTR